MNRAVPWSVRGVGFDAREAARDAARRAGMPLGEWLNQVIAESASESGIDPDDLDTDQKLEAISEQLSRLTGREAAPGRRAASPERPTRRAREERLRSLESQAPAPRSAAYEDWADDLHDDTRARPQRLREDVRRRARHLDDDRPALRGEVYLSQADAEHLLDDAVAAFERRTLKAQGRTDAALGDVARRLAEIEQRLTQRGDDAAQPLRATFDRLERRIESFGRRINEQSEDDGRVEAGLLELGRRLDMLAERLETRGPKDSGDELLKKLDSRLDKKLGSILEAVRQQPASSSLAAPLSSSGLESGPRRIVGRHPLRAGLDQAVADISLRQRLLDGAAPSPLPESAAASDFDRRIETIARRLEKAASPGLLTDLHAEVGRLASRLDEMAARPQRAPEPGPHYFEDARRQIGASIDAKFDAKFDAMRGSMEAELSALSRAIAGLAPRETIERLETTIESLGDRIDETRARGIAEEALAPVERMAADLRSTVERMDPRGLIADLDSEVRRLGERLDQVSAQGFDLRAFEEMRHQTREVRDLLSAAAARPLPLDKIEKEVAQLGQRLDRMSAASVVQAHPGMADALIEIRTMVESGMRNPGIDALERRVEALAGKLDAAISRPQPARDESAIESMIADLAGRIEEARNTGVADVQAMNAMRADIARISRRIEEAGLGAAATQSIERSITGLAGQIEDMRRSAIEVAGAAAEKAASQAVREAMRDLPASNENSLLVSRALADVQAVQNETDRRTHSSLTAVHDMLERIVDRLTVLEDEVAESPAVRPAPAHMPEPAPVLRPAPAPTAASTEPRSGTLDDLLIEPGTGFAPSGKGRGSGTLAEPADMLTEPPTELRAERAPVAAPPKAGKAASASNTFIAAARRLQAQTAADTAIETAAAKAAAAQKAKAEQKGLSDSKDQATGTDGAPARSFLETRKKPLLIGLLGLSVALGTVAVVRNLTSEPSGPTPAEGSAKTSVAPVASAPPQSAIVDPAPDPALPPAPVTAEAQPLPAPVPVDGGAVGSIDPSTLTGPAGLRSAALSGNAAAQYEIGARFAEGRGVTRDHKAASIWLERAAAQGLAPAQYRLATLFEKGLGVSRDTPLARAWYEKAAQKGNARAMHNLAVLVADGAGSKPDYALAAEWFGKAAELGIRDSQYNLAILYARGLGIEQNLMQSYRWFAIAAGQGDEDAAKKRDEVGQRLTANQLKEGKVRAETFRAKAQDPAANDVPVPAAGWEAPARPGAGEPKVQSRAPVKPAGTKTTSL